jgi:aspartyl-tRNA(Asn)/glutamyl-tRNA(Gln) amidotransferase subunit C
MARVTTETVEHVARLARVSLSPEELALFAPQLQEILEYAEQIQALDTAGVPPMSHAGVGASLREDSPAPGLEPAAALAAAPDAAERLFRVPRVLGG